MNAQDHLAKAAEIRHVAATIGEPSLRRELFRIAAHFETLAGLVSRPSEARLAPVAPPRAALDTGVSLGSDPTS
jgi:hypothetical protein